MSKGANGETIMREIVTPKNPQTDAQLIQRVIMATVMKAYGAMKEITDHSFEGYTAGQQTMGRFQSLNAKALRTRIEDEIHQGYDLGSIFAFSKLSDARFVPGDYIISAGSLPTVAAAIVSATASKVTVGATAAVSYQDIIKAFGLQRGDQLTFVELKGTNYDNIKFHFARIILDPTNADGTPAPITSAFVSGGAVNMPSPRNEGQFGSITGNQDVQFSVGPSDQVTQAVGIIVSRKSGDTWQRSACRLAVADANLNLFPSLQQAMASVSAGIAVTSNRFLNNSGQGAVAQESAQGLTAQTISGTEVVLTGMTFDAAGNVLLNDHQGNRYWLKGTCMRNSNYGKYINQTENVSEAPEGATDANTIGTQPLFQHEDGSLDNNIGWLLNHGLPIGQITA